MLIRYKKSMEKIAMGLLSFMPEEKEVKKLQQTIKTYNDDPDWNLFLWKDEEDILGAVGVRVEDQDAVIQHVTVNPSHRNMGIGKKMIQEVKNMYAPMHTVTATEDTQHFLDKCGNDN